MRRAAERREQRTRPDEERTLCVWGVLRPLLSPPPLLPLAFHQVTGLANDQVQKSPIRCSSSRGRIDDIEQQGMLGSSSPRWFRLRPLHLRTSSLCLPHLLPLPPFFFRKRPHYPYLLLLRIALPVSFSRNGGARPPIWRWAWTIDQAADKLLQVRPCLHLARLANLQHANLSV